MAIEGKADARAGIDRGASAAPLPAGDRPGPARNKVGRSSRLREFDTATILGLAGAFTLIAAAISMGGSWGAFVDIPAMFIVVGGTFAVTTISFDLADVARAQHIVLKSIARPVRNPAVAVIEVLQIAERCRREGLLELHRELADRGTDAFLLRGLELAADGMPGTEMERIMRKEMNAVVERHAQGADVLHRAAEVAPAMGLIGTLVGLVQMLGNLEDPSTIGPSMAVALLTTFYGAILANTVFAPLAGKLERRTVDETLLNEIYLSASASIGRQENPRRLELLLNTLLPPAKRVTYFT